MLGKITGNRPPQKMSEEDIWEAFMGLNDTKTENRYETLTDHIQESKPSTEVQVYKDPEEYVTYYEYFSNKIYNAYRCITGLIW